MFKLSSELILYISKTKIKSISKHHDYIVSPCSFFADGLSRLITNSIVIPYDSLPEENFKIRKTHPSRIVFFMPDNVGDLFLSLNSFVNLVNSNVGSVSSIVIISSAPVCFVWSALKQLVEDSSILSCIRFISPNLSVDVLDKFLNTERYNLYPKVKQYSNYNSLMKVGAFARITKAEFLAMLSIFQCVDIKAHAAQLGLSNKTIYNQRKCALKKIIKYYPEIILNFPGIKRDMKKISDIEQLSSFEEDFIHAIHTKDVFFVYQPITDENLSLKGFELLCRWNRKEETLMPQEFLSRLKSNYSWISLTAHALNEAICKINELNGPFYFSVNLHPNVLNNRNLCKMVLLACKNLSNSNNISRLVFEVSELTNITHKSITSENIKNLRDLGLNIFLDDCFSQGSVFFPVRNISFDGYKIDMNIINSYKKDLNALYLLKSLVYYCKLTNSVCIAEGVENQYSVKELNELGIGQFQGFSISKPVSSENISMAIRKFYPQ